MPSKPSTVRNVRRALLPAALVALVLVAGCSGSVLGDSYTFESSPVTVDEAALQDTGFQHQDSEEIWFNETRTIQDQEVEIRVSSHVGLYTKATEIGGERMPYAGFVTVSMPEADVLGQPMNPIAGMSNRELVDRMKSYVDDAADDRYGELRDVRRTGTSRITVLGQQTEVTEFRATGETSSGEEGEAVLYVTKVVHGDDVVVLVGAYPVKVGSGDDAVTVDESDAVRTLMESVSHDA